MSGCIKSIIGALRGDEKSAKPLRKAIRQGSEIIIPEHVQREVSRIVKDGKTYHPYCSKKIEG